MRRLVLLLMIAACAVVSSGCSLKGPSSSPAIGDACLVGNWHLDHETNKSGWSYANTPVAVAGLAGARLTVGADGAETESFAGSEPLVGALADGRVLSITLDGSFKFHLHADGHEYVETGTITTLPVSATLGGVPIPGYHGSYTPATGTYTCSQRTLTTTTSSGIQTDSWLR